MKKRDTVASFRDIDPSRFRASPDAGAGVHAPGAAGKIKGLEPIPDIGDENALFLEALSGAVDVSAKMTPVEIKSSPKKKKRPPSSGIAVSSPPSPPPSEREAGFAGTLPRGIPEPEPAAPEYATEDERLFTGAMNGVWPVRARGRDLTPSAKSAPRIPETWLRSMDDVYSGKAEFSLEYTDEFIQGHVAGMDPAILGKLRAGSFSPEGHLDLHGQNLEQAYAALAAFIKHAYQDGKRHLLIITGRGKNSPGGTPVLRERVQSWFTRDPFKRVILAFCTAKPSDGGAGALYLLLRKRKKSQGKIVWDRKPSEEELLL